jgi:hypothetical protein
MMSGLRRTISAVREREMVSHEIHHSGREAMSLLVKKRCQHQWHDG